MRFVEVRNLEKEKDMATLSADLGDLYLYVQLKLHQAKKHSMQPYLQLKAILSVGVVWSGIVGEYSLL